MKKLILSAVIAVSLTTGAHAAPQDGFVVNGNVIQLPDANGNLNINSNNFHVNPGDTYSLNAPGTITINGGNLPSNFGNQPSGQGPVISMYSQPITEMHVTETGPISVLNIESSAHMDGSPSSVLNMRDRTQGRVNIEHAAEEQGAQKLASHITNLEPASGSVGEGAAAMNLQGIDPSFDSSKLSYDANGNVMLKGD